MSLFFLTAPFVVSSIFQGFIPNLPTSVVMQTLIASYLALYLLKRKTMVLTKFELTTIFLFIAPVMISILGVFVASILEQNIVYQRYVSSNLLNRVFIVTLNITILVGLLTMTSNWTIEKVLCMIKKYYYGLVIFTLVGVWQFLHFTFGIPFIDIGSRSYIHSVQGTSLFISQRLTSLAAEPSFLAPLVIDLMILTWLLSKKPIRAFILGLFVLIFSYSGGGYLNLSILVIAYIFGHLKFKGYKVSKKQCLYFFLVSLLVLVFIAQYSNNIYEILYPVLNRTNSIFDIQKSGRMYMFIMPFIWVLRNNIINALFGYGPNSFNYLNQTETLTNGSPVHVTSNNLYSDTVFELGYIGLASYITIPMLMIKKTWGGMYRNRYYMIAYMLTVHIFLSSIYRADFMQPRFWVIIFIILKLIKQGGGDSGRRE